MEVSGEEKEWTPPTLEEIKARSKELFALTLDERLQLTERVIDEIEVMLAIVIPKFTVLTESDYEALIRERETDEDPSIDGETLGSYLNKTSAEKFDEVYPLFLRLQELGHADPSSVPVKDLEKTIRALEAENETKTSGGEK